MYHIFFILSSVSGHLGCFHVLPIVNSAEVNIGMHASFQILVSSIYMPRCGINGLYGKSIFSFEFFKEAFILFSKVAVSAYNPTNSAREFPSLHTLSSIYYLQIFFMMAIWYILIIVFDLLFSNN